MEGFTHQVFNRKRRIQGRALVEVQRRNVGSDPPAETVAASKRRTVGHGLHKGSETLCSSPGAKPSVQGPWAAYALVASNLKGWRASNPRRVGLGVGARRP